jgi:DNA-directed RNA polymerase subunit RPC12/RpoP
MEQLTAWWGRLIRINEAKKLSKQQNKMKNKTKVVPNRPVKQKKGRPPEKEARFRCSSCGADFEDDSDAVTVYECGDDGTRFTENTWGGGAPNLCPDCGKFAAKASRSFLAVPIRVVFRHSVVSLPFSTLLTKQVCVPSAFSWL